MRFRPIHGFVAFAVFFALVVGFGYALQGGLERSDYRRVSPGRDGQVRIDLGEIDPGEVAFFHFLNPSNQEVRFFVGRDAGGTVQVAFDANDLCYKLKRGYRQEGAWVVCNKCDKSFRLAEVNAGGGGCKPVPVAHHVAGDELVLAESDILAGWRYFR